MDQKKSENKPKMCIYCGHKLHPDYDENPDVCKRCVQIAHLTDCVEELRKMCNDVYERTKHITKPNGSGWINYDG